MPAEYVETLYVDPDTLHAYPGNPNRADVAELRGSVRSNGQYRPVVARRLPDGRLQILAGHGTTEATGMVAGKVRVEVLAADDATARRIVARDNVRPRGSVMDELALLDLLDKVNAEEGADGLLGAGYSRQERDDLARFLQPPSLDDFARQVGDHGDGDGWPTLNLKVPHHVAAAWQEHLDSRKGNVPAAFAALLGVGVEPEGWDGT